MKRCARCRCVNAPVRIRGSCEVVYDSRNVSRRGKLLVAMQGGTTDGNRFVENARQQGAVAVVTDSEPTWQKIRAEHPELRRRALSNVGAAHWLEISASFFSSTPSASLHSERRDRHERQDHDDILVGVDAAQCGGVLAVLVGTIEYHVGERSAAVAAHYARIPRSAGSVCRGSEPRVRVRR